MTIRMALSTMLGSMLLGLIVVGSVRSDETEYPAIYRNVSLQLNPPEGILFGEDTPVYLARSDDDSNIGYRICQNTNAMPRIKASLENSSKNSTKDPDVCVDLSTDDKTLSNDTSPSKDSATALNDNVVHPRIFVVVDYAAYKSMGENLDQMLKYLIYFWSSVDMRFRSLENPKVRLNIAGILIATDKNAIPFISQYKLMSDESSTGISMFASYMKSARPYFSSIKKDMVVLSLKYENCGGNPIDCKYTRGISSGHGTVFYDNGAFGGVKDAARYVGKRLGGGNEQHQWDYNAGYIMSSGSLWFYENTETMPEWTDDELKTMKNYLRSESAKHFYEKPKTTSPLPRVLPGNRLSLNKQCAMIGGMKPCDTPMSDKEDFCSRYLDCQTVWDEKLQGDRPVADGTPCDTEKICLNGVCRFLEDIK